MSLADQERHRVSLIVNDTRPGRGATGWCECGWTTGRRRARYIAAAALASHITRERAEETPKARAVLADHVAGLHADFDDPAAGCLYSGCAEAYWLLALRAGPGVHEVEALIGDDQ